MFYIISIFLNIILSFQLFRRNLFSSSSMPVNLNQYRLAVGVFNSNFFIDKKHRISFSNNPFQFSVNLTISDYFSIILTGSYTYFVLIFFFLLNVVKYNFKINSLKKFVCNFTSFYICLFWLISIFLNWSEDIEKNPGPKTKSCQSFSICHWNLNSILPTISLKCRYCRLTKLFKSMMLFAFGNLPKLLYSIWWWQFGDPWI